MAAIEILSAAVSRRLVHLETVKADLGITDTSADVSLLRSIDIVTAEAVRLLGREPWRQQYKIRMPGDGGTHLELPVWPAETPSLVRQGVTSPTTVTAADYEVVDRYGEGWWRWLYRDDEWHRSGILPATNPGDRDLYYEVTLFAGWATPWRQWEASTVVRLGEYALATDRSETTVFECTTAGTTHTAEPTWVTTDGATTTETGGVVWTARASARPLPENLHAAGIWAVKMLYRVGDIIAPPPGIVEMQQGSTRTRWSVTGTRAPVDVLPAVSVSVYEAYS